MPVVQPCARELQSALLWAIRSQWHAGKEWRDSRKLRTYHQLIGRWCCSDSGAVRAFVGGYVRGETSVSGSQTLTLREAFTSDVLTRFETAINDGVAGLYGDIVVTVGVTVLITDSFFVDFDNAGNCAIDMQYSPTWKPSAEKMLDSLQITPRVALPGVIDNWQRQVCPCMLFLPCFRFSPHCATLSDSRQICPLTQNRSRPQPTA